MKNAALVLQNIVREMDSRYELMGAAKARNLSEWNAAADRPRDRTRSRTCSSSSTSWPTS